MTPSPPVPPDPQVVDLVAIGHASAPVIEYYDAMRVAAERGEPLDDETKAHLGEALERLRRLPRCGGRLGRAIAVVASGGSDFSVGDTIAALELLRGTLDRRGRLRPSLTQPPALALVGEAPVQLGLPGFEGDAERPGNGSAEPHAPPG
ncbi:MAG TPA: hypothetical protein VK988_01245 [Acidimicrobiales bacterium]|nr:hypothetical protein [Acidimicrobiales bacterium]